MLRLIKFLFIQFIPVKLLQYGPQREKTVLRSQKVCEKTKAQTKQLAVLKKKISFKLASNKVSIATKTCFVASMPIRQVSILHASIKKRRV